MNNIRVLLFAVSLCAASGQALALDVEVVQGDGRCPAGRTLLDYAQATANEQEVCKVLGEWYIARLAGGGSMDGPGYECKIRRADERSLGHSLCVAQAQPDCATERELLTIPEVTRDAKAQKLKAVLMLSDEDRSMWVRKQGSSTEGRCLKQRLRYLTVDKTGIKYQTGMRPIHLQARLPAESAIPGPTFRARIGDLIQIGFRNQVDTKNFPTSLDKGDCDVATGTAPDRTTEQIKVKVYPRNNKMPNCVHGSSTTNVHFHGTHTTPDTTGDNVLIGIRPALRVKGANSNPRILSSRRTLPRFSGTATKSARRQNGNNFRHFGERIRNVSSSCTMQPRRTKG